MSEQKQLSGPEGLTTIGEMTQDIRIALLTTVAADGTLESRPMATQQPQLFDGRLWLLTRDESGAVTRIRQNSPVSLLYQAEGSATCLTVKGLANVSDDRMKIQVLWNAMYKSQFPNGPADPAIAVVTVDVTEAQVWQASSNGIVQGQSIVLSTAASGTQSAGQIGRTQTTRQQGNTIPVGQPAKAGKAGQTVNAAVEERTGELV